MPLVTRAVQAEDSAYQITAASNGTQCHLYVYSKQSTLCKAVDDAKPLSCIYYKWLQYDQVQKSEKVQICREQCKVINVKLNKKYVKEH